MKILWRLIPKCNITQKQPLYTKYTSKAVMHLLSPWKETPLAASQTASQVCIGPIETRHPGCEVIFKTNYMTTNMACKSYTSKWRLFKNFDSILTHFWLYFHSRVNTKIWYQNHSHFINSLQAMGPEGLRQPKDTFLKLLTLFWLISDSILTVGI